MNARSIGSRRAFWTISLLGLGLVVVAIISLRQWAGNDPLPRPHIIMITADTLRKDRLGVYGSLDSRTPVLDRLARGAYQFPNFVSSSNNTNVSFASLHTGAFMRTHKVQGLSFLGYRLEESFETLSEAMSEAGYLTVAAVSAPVVQGAASGLMQGFDVYLDCGDYAKQPAAITNSKLIEAMDRLVAEEASGDSRLFIWLHYFDPHWPYEPESPRDAMFLDGLEGEFGNGEEPVVPDFTKGWDQEEDEREYFRRQYSGEVHYADEYVGRFLDELETRGILDESVVIFTSDHGENLGERGLFANHQRLYQPVSEPPLLVRLPGQTTGRTIDVAVQTVDLLPTCLELAGIDRSPHQVEGTSLVPWLEGDGPRDRIVFSEGAYQKEKIVRRGPYKLAYRLQPQFSPGDSFELYNVEEDPAELVDLRHEEPDVLRELQEEMRKFMGEIPIRLKITSLDGERHRVKGVLRTLRCSIIEAVSLSLEAEDRHEYDDASLVFDWTVEGEDEDEILVEADWTAAFGVTFEVDGRPFDFSEIRLGSYDPARTIYRSLLFLDEDSSGDPAPSGCAIRVERSELPDGGTEVVMHFDVAPEIARRARERGVPTFEARVFGGDFGEVRIEPQGAAVARQSAERLQILGVEDRAVMRFVVPRDTVDLLTDFRIGDEAAPPAEIGVGAGLRAAPQSRYAALLYSPRFRLTRESAEGAPGPRRPADRQGAENAPILLASDPQVRIELHSPFLEAADGSGSLGGFDISRLSPEDREKLEKLGYLETSDNQQN